MSLYPKLLAVLAISIFVIASALTSIKHESVHRDFFQPWFHEGK